MNSHLRSAALTIILAGGTLVSYATVYALMESPATASDIVAPTESVRPIATSLPAGQTDMSVREACAAFEDSNVRVRCRQEIGSDVRTVRVIGLAQAATRHETAEVAADVGAVPGLQTGRSVAISH
jgi:hypothetical protein